MIGSRLLLHDLLGASIAIAVNKPRIYPNNANITIVSFIERLRNSPRHCSLL